MTQNYPGTDFYVISHKKRLQPIATMMATLATGDLPPCLNTFDTLLSIHKDNEDLVFLADCAPNIAFKTKTNCGTQTHVAHHVTKIHPQCHTAASQHDNLNRLT